jgi:hypothetical protein
MIKNTLLAGTIVCVGAAFALGFYMGWKTTTCVLDDVMQRKKKSQQN